MNTDNPKTLPGYRELKEMPEADVWALRDSGTPGAFDAAVEEICRRYNTDAARIASSMLRRRGYPEAFYEQLLSGTLSGLLVAARGFNPSGGGAAWRTYFYQRATGSAIDAVREASEFPRSMMPALRFVWAWEEQNMRMPTLKELAKAFPTSHSRYLRAVLVGALLSARSVSNDSAPYGWGSARLRGDNRRVVDLAFSHKTAGDSETEKEVIRAETFEEILAAFEAISDPEEREITKARLLDGKTNVELGQRYGVSDSRISQIVRKGRAEILQYCRQSGIAESLHDEARSERHAMVHVD